MQIERRLAPFWRGLNDYSESWTENQLVAVGRGKPIPAPDEIPSEEQAVPFLSPDRKDAEKLNSLTVPISSRSQSYASDSSSNMPQSPAQAMPPPNFTSPPSSGPAMFRGRAKTLASLTTSSKNSQPEMTPREMQLPRDNFVNGQPIEVFLYKDAAECPICFLYYPPYLNRTRCCDQSICSECFVQIKRPDPHPPEHGDQSEARQNSNDSEGYGGEDELVSGPAACPFCVQPEFGITYESPPFRRGLTYVNHMSVNTLPKDAAAMSSSTSLSSALSAGPLSPNSINRRRAGSVSANDPSVITTDRVRSDWHQKLTSARQHAARRSAAATALHTAAYLMGNRGQDSDSRGFPSFGRRGILRRASGNDSPSGSSSHLNMLAILAERHAAGAGRGEGDAASSMVPPRGSSRRNRMEDLEDMMMMEAIRLSLASEDERRKKEEKEAKKEAKKTEKENKKAEKAARKAGGHSNSASRSFTGLGSRSESSLASDERLPKGKTVQRTGGEESEHMPPFSMTSAAFKPSLSNEYTGEDAQGHLERARAQLQPEVSPSLPYGMNARRPSHLRNQSNLSSAASSMTESVGDSFRNDMQGSTSSFDASPSGSGIDVGIRGPGQESLMSNTPPGGGAGMEPMFNFRSLAEMVGKDQELDPAEQSKDEDETASESLDGHVERSDSMATVQPKKEEYHEASEFPSEGGFLHPKVESAETAVTDGTKSTASAEQAELSKMRETVS